MAAAQGIDYLNLVKSVSDVEDEMAAQQQQATQQSLVDQASQFMNTPLMDPSKNPGMNQMLKDGYDQLQQAKDGNNQGVPPDAGEEEAPPEG